MNEKQRFGEILVRAGVLERDVLDSVLAHLGDKRVDLGEALVSRGLLDEATMLQAVGKALNLPTVGLDHAQPDEQALALVPRSLCEQFALIPIEVERSRTGEHLHVAMANPTDVQAIKQVTRRARRRIRPLLAPARSIKAAVERFYGADAPSSSGISSSADRIDESGSLSRGQVAQPRAPAPSQRPQPPKRPAPPPPVPRLPDIEPVVDLQPPPVSRTARRPSEPLPDGARALIPPDLAPGSKPARSTMALRRGLDADLLDALDNSAKENIAGPADLALGGGGNRGGEYVVRRPRRPRARGQLDTGNLPGAPPGMPGPLPALPPGLGSRRRRPERTTNRPEPRRRPGSSPPPAQMPTSRHAGEVLEVDLDLPTPEGVIDDRASDDKVDVRRLLERLVSDGAEDESGADQVVSDYLDRYGSGMPGTGDRTFAALDQALGSASGGTARLLVALIRHLARRGLVDLDELIASLSD